MNYSRKVKFSFLAVFMFLTLALSAAVTLRWQDDSKNVAVREQPVPPSTVGHTDTTPGDQSSTPAATESAVAPVATITATSAGTPAAVTPERSSSNTRPRRNANASSEKEAANAATSIIAPQASNATASTAPATDTKAAGSLTDEAVAKKRNITVAQVRRLREARALTNAEIAALPYDRLERYVFRLDHPKAQMLEDMFRQRGEQMKDENGEIPENALLRAYEQKAEVPIVPQVWGSADKTERSGSGNTVNPSVAGIDRTGWTSIGPGNIGGRIRAIAIDPTTPTTMYIGAAGGGVWKSTNDGASWTPLNDFMANLAVTSIVIDPTNTNVLYAATGEAFSNADALRGAGIFKSIDAGATWSQLSTTANASFFGVTRLTIDPTNSQTLLASTSTVGGAGSSGIWRSTDGGANWTRTSSAANFTDVDFSPTNGNVAIAGSKTGAYYSTNGGQTWTAATGFAESGFNVGRIEVTYAKANPSIVYASVNLTNTNVTPSASVSRIYKSGDGGATYGKQGTDQTFLGGQGWYDNVIWAGDPLNADHVMVGGVDLWRSLNGGITLNKLSHWQCAPNSAHADHHAIVEHPQYDGVTNKTVFFGNDGGIYKANDALALPSLPINPTQCFLPSTSGWQELNNNLSITQFYGAAGNAASGRIVGGTQDNGTLRMRPDVANPSENWNAPFGGDGGWAAYDPTDPNYFYGEYVYLQIHRGTTATGNSSYIYNGITEAVSGSANFIAPFILDPNDPNRLLGGARSLWRTNNAKASPASSIAWTAIKPSIGANISAIAVKPGNSDLIWVGHNNGSIYYTTNGTAATPTWTQVTGLAGRYVTRITLSNAGDNRAYVTLGGFSTGNVQMTANNGATWSNIANGLPQAPVRSLVIHPSNPDWLYVGTEVGVFASTNGGATWSTTNDGPANVSVDELFWMGNKLVAATHGRGLFTTTPGTEVVQPTIQFAAATQTIIEQNDVIQVQVTRSEAAAAASVEYLTNDDPRLFNCNPTTTGVPGGAIPGVATSRCDYSSTVGVLNFAAGESSKTINVPLSDDLHVEGAETFSISLRNARGAALGALTTDTITIQDNDATNTGSNPYHDNYFFVRQHYLDFLGRNPTDAEVNTWTRVIAPDCGLTAPDACYDRIWISGKGFFESQEFQQKGYYVYRFYKALGASRLPTYNEFIPDMVNMADTSEAQKNIFALQFTQRAEYQSIYGALLNDQFVDTLIQRTGLTTLNAAQMKSDLNAGRVDRWVLLRQAVESGEMNQREFNNAWVIMQYFGYLRRDGAASEYNAWLSVINADPTQWRTMINGFMNSTEYKQRFGDPLR